MNENGLLDLDNDLGFNRELLGRIGRIVGRADARKESGRFNSFLEFFHLSISNYIDFTESSINVLCPFVDDKKSKCFFTFSYFNNDREQIKISTNLKNFPNTQGSGDKWAEYETVCLYLDTYEDKELLAQKILSCLEWRPSNLSKSGFQVEIKDIKAFLDNQISKMRNDQTLDLESLKLNVNQMRAANMMFGLAICEHHRVSGSSKHFRTCLGLVGDKLSFSKVFGFAVDDTKCILSAAHGTSELRSIFDSCIVPEEAEDAFEFSESSEDEKEHPLPKSNPRPVGAVKFHEAKAAKQGEASK